MGGFLMTTLSQFFPGSSGSGPLRISTYGTAGAFGAYIPYSSGGSWMRVTMVGGGGGGNSGSYPVGGQGGQSLVAWVYNTTTYTATTAVAASTTTKTSSSISNSSGVLTVNWSSGSAFITAPPVGSSVTITGTASTGLTFNGTWTVTSSTKTQVVLSTTGTGTVSGTATASFPTNVFTFATQASAPTVGGYIATGSIIPTGYNVTSVVIASSTTTATVFSSTTGSVTQQGTICFNPYLYTIGAGGAGTTSSTANSGTNTYFGLLVAEGGGGSSGSQIYSCLGGMAWGAYASITSATSSTGTGTASPAASVCYLQNVSGGVGGANYGVGYGGFAPGSFPNGWTTSGTSVVVTTSASNTTNVFGSATSKGSGGDSLYGGGGAGTNSGSVGGNGTGYGGGGGTSTSSSLSGGSGSGGLLIIEDFGSNG